MAMNKGKVLIVLLVVVLFAFSGCTGGGNKQATVQKSSPFAGGSQGLAVSFVPGSPTDTVVAGENFGVSVQLENKGETRIEGTGKIKITGINPASFSNPNLEQGYIPELGPVQKIGSKAVPGESATVDFNGLKYSGLVTTGQFDFNIIADVCYKYATNAFATTCVTENLLKQTVGANACKTSGAKTVVNSGGPIHVSSVEQIPSGPNRLGFKLTIKNVGGGKTVGFSCDNLVPANADKVMISSVSLGDTLFDCGAGADGAKEVKLINGEATVFCKADVPAGTFEDLTNINLLYYYDQKAAKKLTVQALG
ncbi:MAG: hypothetical protein HY438_01890 [DPANN group archaeon]|nr:hypothetical protein [DPANN group archaeon]